MGKGGGLAAMWKRSLLDFGHKDVGAFVEFSTSEGEQVMVQTGISLVSVEQARLNLDTELSSYGWDFDAVRQGCERNLEQSTG